MECCGRNWAGLYWGNGVEGFTCRSEWLEKVGARWPATFSRHAEIRTGEPKVSVWFMKERVENTWFVVNYAF